MLTRGRVGMLLVAHRSNPDFVMDIVTRDPGALLRAATELLEERSFVLAVLGRVRASAAASKLSGAPLDRPTSHACRLGRTPFHVSFHVATVGTK